LCISSQYVIYSICLPVSPIYFTNKQHSADRNPAALHQAGHWALIPPLFQVYKLDTAVLGSVVLGVHPPQWVDNRRFVEVEVVHSQAAAVVAGEERRRCIEYGLAVGLGLWVRNVIHLPCMRNLDGRNWGADLWENQRRMWQALVDCWLWCRCSVDVVVVRHMGSMVVGW